MDENKRGHKGLKQEIINMHALAEQTFYLEQQHFKLSNMIKANKLNISKVMGTKRRSHFKVDKHLSFNVQKEVTTNIDFCPTKLKESLSKKDQNKVIDKEYSVNDMDGLIQLMKKYYVPSKEFKKFITVKEKPNIDELDTLLAIGDIDIEDLHGSYKVEFEDSIKVSKVR